MLISKGCFINELSLMVKVKITLNSIKNYYYMENLMNDEKCKSTSYIKNNRAQYNNIVKIIYFVIQMHFYPN